MFKKKCRQSIICLIMASIYILGTSGWGPTLASKISLPFSSFLCAGHGCGCDRAGYELEGCRCFTSEGSTTPSSSSCCALPEPPPPSNSCCSTSPEPTALDTSTQLTLPSCGSPSLDGTDFLATHIIFPVIPQETLSFSTILKLSLFTKYYSAPLLIGNDKIPIARQHKV